MVERMKTVFTTGEAAKICKVSQQTIIRCFDSGQLKGFRVPGSRFRRIPREDATYYGWYGLFGGITDAICAPMNEVEDFNKRVRDPAGLGVQGR